MTIDFDWSAYKEAYRQTGALFWRGVGGWRPTRYRAIDAAISNGISAAGFKNQRSSCPAQLGRSNERLLRAAQSVRAA